MVYKSFNGLAPNYLSSKFIQRSDIITSSDFENKLAVPLQRTNYYKNSFSYKDAVLAMEQSAVFYKQNLWLTFDRC